MVMEKILSVPAGTSPVLVVSDCLPVANNVNTIGTPGAGSGATLLPSGDVDFNATAPAGYSMLYTACGPTDGQARYHAPRTIHTPTSTTLQLITDSPPIN